MGQYVLDALNLRAADLQRKLAARKGAPGFSENVREIESAIAEINEEIARQTASSSEGALTQPPSQEPSNG